LYFQNFFHYFLIIYFVFLFLSINYQQMLSSVAEKQKTANQNNILETPPKREK